VDLLHELFTRHGVHVESQLSKTMKGVTGMQAMAEMMDALRADPPKEVAGIAVKEVLDVEKNIVREMTSGTTKEGPDLPASNVLIFRLMDGSVVVARPSGTEPKIKFYFMVVDREGIPFADAGVLGERLDACRAKEEALKADFNGKLEALSR
jgi:phosphomannomutase